MKDQHPDKMVSEFVTTTSPQCMDCDHRDSDDPFRCLAFPDGIPNAILDNQADHTKPYKGDHGIRFQKRGKQ